MKQITKFFVVCCAAAPLICLGATNDSGTSGSPVKPAMDIDSLFTNSVVAKGKGVSITRNQLDNEVIRVKAMLAAQGRNIGPEDSAAVEEQVLDSLVGKQLVLAKATPADREKGKEEFTKAIEKIKTSSKLTEDEYNQRLNQQLRLLNISKEDWEKQSAEQATIPVTLARELNVNISDADVKKFYDDNPAKFEQPEMVRAAHILLMTTDPVTHADLPEDKKAEKKKLIETILKEARAGTNFAELAKKYSEDPGSKDNGGEYTFPRGQMVPEFEAAAFSLNTNQISDVVTTQFGYHIIKLYEKIPAKKLALTDKLPGDNSTTVEQAIKDSLTTQALQKEATDYVEKLKKDANVEILDPKLKAAAEAREKVLENMKSEESSTNAPKLMPTPAPK